MPYPADELRMPLVVVVTSPPYDRTNTAAALTPLPDVTSPVVTDIVPLDALFVAFTVLTPLIADVPVTAPDIFSIVLPVPELTTPTPRSPEIVVAPVDTVRSPVPALFCARMP